MLNDDDENEENVSHEEEQKKPQGLINNLKSKLKDPFTPIGISGNKASKGAMGMIAKLTKALPPHIKIIIIAIVIICILIFAVMILSLVQEVTDTTTENVEGYFKTNTSMDTSVKSLYDNKASLIKLKLVDINAMYDKYKEDNEEMRNDIFANFSAIKGSNILTSQTARIAKVDDKLELYKHILLTEKYDFNRIKWKAVNRSDPTKLTDAKLIAGRDANEKEMGLQFPDDDNLDKDNDPVNTTKLDTFIDMTLPYLQTWYIPLSMASRFANRGADTIDSTFIYSILEYAGTDMEINQYNMQTYTKVTTYRDGADVGSSITEIGQIKYCITKADSYDLKVRNEYTYTPYTTDQVNGNIDPDTEFQSSSSLISESDEKGGHKNVEIHTVTRIWNDKLIPGTTVKEPYKYIDLVEYNKNINDNLPAISPSKVADIETDIAADTNTSGVYKTLEADKLLNRIDFMNSSPNLYKEYLKENENATKYMGYTRGFLVYQYAQLKRLFTAFAEKHHSLPYIYGHSVGVDELYLTSSGGSSIGGGSGVFKCFPLPYYVEQYNSNNARVLSTVINSDFGFRTHPISGKPNNHSGIDLPRPQTDDIVAANDGTVIVLYNGNTYGNYVIIDHHNQYFSLYGHMSKVTVTNGAEIKAGDKIGKVGSTGNSTGPHLHFEVRTPENKYQNAVDPKQFYNEDFTPVGGGSIGFVVNGDPTSEEVANKEQFLNEMKDCEWKTYGAWTVQLYRDNPTELIARLINEEAGPRSINGNAAADTEINIVKAHALAMVNRLKKNTNSTMYDIILYPNQFRITTSAAADRFNVTPPQWIRDICFKALSGNLDPPPYWDKDNYFWLGAGDTNYWMYNNTTQTVGYKWNNDTYWHVFAKTGPKASQDICGKGPKGLYLLKEREDPLLKGVYHLPGATK